MEYEFLHISTPFYFDFKFEKFTQKNIIITSQYAAFDGALNLIDKNAKFFVVGEISARKIAAFGFKNIEIFSSISHLLSSLDLTKDFLYIRGVDVSFEIKTIISNLSEVVVYKMEYQSGFTGDQRLLFTEKLERIFLFSDIVCKNFIEISTNEKIIDLIAKKDIFCISQGGVDVFKKAGLIASKFNHQ